MNITKTFREIIRFIVIFLCYDEHTIVRYFRKQGAQIGQGCRFITRSLGDEPYLVRIGNHVTIAGGVKFLTHNDGTWIGRTEVPDLQVFGTIKISDNCIIGQNAILYHDITIGANSIIGAGSVVTSDVPPNSIVMGVPARIVGSSDKYKKRCIAEWQIQRPHNIVIENGSNWWDSKQYDENRKKLREHLTKIFRIGSRGEDNVKVKKLIFTTMIILCGRDSRSVSRKMHTIHNYEQLMSFQQERLSTLLLHAYQNVTYYHDIFEEIGLVKKGEVDLAKFENVPLLTKDIMRKYSKKLISADWHKRKSYFESSGGSTGEPLKLIQDENYRIWGDATNYYWYRDILGIDGIGAKKVILWGSPRDLHRDIMDWKNGIVNWAANTTFLNSFRMTDDDMSRYIIVINSRQPDVIRGYASSLYELCRYAQRQNITLYSPRILISTADMLLDEMRVTIEQVFRTKVFNFYGSRESNNLAGECNQGMMHIFAFHNYIEVLDSHNLQVAEGKEGKVIVTNLHNYAMPIIRYEIGDMATLGPTHCLCGNPLPTLMRINGRIADQIICKDGTLISPLFFTMLFRFVEWVREFQVNQEDYQHIKITIVLQDKVYEDDIKRIENNILRLMGRECLVSWEFVDEIPRTVQGKYRYVRSLVHKTN